MSALIQELNDLLASGEAGAGSGGQAEAVAPEDAVAARLSPANRAVFDLLPQAIRSDLLRERDPHGNVQVPLHLLLAACTTATCTGKA